MSNFETKEQYLTYISGWKSATNAEEAKSKRVVCDHVQYNWNYHGYTDEEKAHFEEKGYTKIENLTYTIPDGGHRKESGWLSAEHYIFHNMMRGKDPRRGFTPKTVERKMNKYESPWMGFIRAAFNLESIVNAAKFIIKNTGKGRIANVPSVEEFLKPFNGKVTLADLASINMEELVNARKFHL